MDTTTIAMTYIQKEIVETARILNSFGNELRAAMTVRSTNAYHSTMSRTEVHYFVTGSAYTGLRSVIGTVDTLLEWLEHSGKRVTEDLKKKAVLMGILRLTELGFQVSHFGMLEYVCRFIDVPDDPYPAEREYLTHCLAEAEQNKERMFQIIEKAGDILREIIDAETVHISKQRQFDNVMREAQLEIQSFRRHLGRAKEMIVELMRKMQVVKWSWRCVKFVGCVTTWYFVYHKYRESSLNFYTMFVGFLVSAIFWLSFIPTRAYAFYVSLSKLDMKHRLLNEGLDDIHERLKSSADHKDKMVDDMRSNNRDN